MTRDAKKLLHSAWNYCDDQDKSTEFMFAYMSDEAGVDYDVAVDFVMSHGSTKRANENLRLGLINEEQHQEWIQAINQD